MEAIEFLIMLIISFLFLMFIKKYYQKSFENEQDINNNIPLNKYRQYSINSIQSYNYFVPGVIQEKNKNSVNDDNRKNYYFHEKNNSSDSEKENLSNIYSFGEKENTEYSDNNNFNNKINSFLLLKQNRGYNNSDKKISQKRYTDKDIYDYLYKLPLIKNRLIIIDTEVSGISSLDHIIELCGREMINGKLTNNYFHSFFRPKKFMTQLAIKKHKIPPYVFRYSYEQEKNIFENFLKFVNGSIIITHNAIFDMEKINYELTYYNLPLIDKNQYRCSMRIFYEKYKKYINKFSKLKECCKFLKIKYDNKMLHLAGYDSLILGKIMEKIYEEEYFMFIKNSNKELYNKINDVNRKEEEKSFDKFIEKNIEYIYKELDEQETNKIIENIFIEEQEKNKAFDKYVNENINDIFDYLKKEEKSKG